MLWDKLEGQKIMFRADICTPKHNLLEANVNLRVMWRIFMTVNSGMGCYSSTRLNKKG